MDTTNKMVCVLGRTCSGKDSLIKSAVKVANIKIIDTLEKATESICFHPKYEFVVSYTTRPKRDCETDGVEHIFISKEEYDRNYSKKYENKLAYTEIDGNIYFTLYSQIDEIHKRGNIPVYIIDFKGLIKLVNKLNNIDIYKIYIHASEEERMARYINRINNVSSEIIKEYYYRSKSEESQFNQYENEITFNTRLDSKILKPNIVLFNETQKDFNLNRVILTQTLWRYAVETVIDI